MNRVYTETHSGTVILIVDLTHLKSGPEFEHTLAIVQNYLASRPPTSVLALTDVSGVRLDQDMLDRMKEFTCKNTPYMKLDAVVGVTGLLQIGLISITRVTGRSFKVFPDRKSAIEWLVSQQEDVLMEKGMP
jgi:hypothetical protein